MRDLKNLVSVGYLTPQGEKRGRSYLATPELRNIYLRSKIDGNFADPFDEVSKPFFEPMES
jgi:hypothetical protein